MESIERLVPEGLLVNREWLQAHGFSRSSIDYFLLSGKLTALSRGVYRKSGPPLKWQHVVYSLQETGFSVHVGRAFCPAIPWVSALP
jgi:hypothetical protein